MQRKLRPGIEEGNKHKGGVKIKEVTKATVFRWCIGKNQAKKEGYSCG